ncbi:MAG: mannose-1-phosphate guanylyltransferase [Bacteroidales bacterium]|nr:mannose-1-phosphate guanylyltransferase [Bacteroidales bacterium]
MSNHIVIMAGGQGTRLYPLSTPEHPKQFIDLLDCGKTMIQLTWERFHAVDPEAAFWVVTSSNYEHFILEQLPQIPRAHILLEPEPRNTAPCIAWATKKILAEDSGANVVVTPSDAWVADIPAHAITLRKALEFAGKDDAVVCIGIKPTEPHTGYGYINVIAGGDRQSPVKVASFTEKPDLETAKRYLAEGGYLWNAGIFVFRAAVMDGELKRFAPQISGRMDELSKSFGTASEASETAKIFPECEKISIDYAVMEKSSLIYCIPATWAWSDLGSFAAIEAVTGKKLPR